MKKFILFSILLLCCAVFSSCGVVERFTATKTPTLTPTPEATATPLPTFTPTPPPSIARVNGFYIADEDYDGKKQQLRDGYNELGTSIPSDEAIAAEALNLLTDETLFLAEAETSGLRPSEDELNERIRQLTEQIGGEDKLREWRDRNHYSPDSLRRALEREISAANVRERIIDQGIGNVEQVHAYRISEYTRGDAQNIMDRLQMGISFESLAAEEDPAYGGDMRWFPRGAALSDKIGDILFSLAPGTYSDIIEYNNAFYIFYVAEKSTGHAFDAQTSQIAEHSLVSAWLDAQRNSAQIEILHQ